MKRVDLINMKYPVDELGQPKVTGLVLSVHDYQEHDGVIHLATPNEIYSVLAKGIQRETSKNRRIALPGSKVQVVYDPQYSRDMLYLIRGSSERYYWKMNDSLEFQTLNAILSILIERHGITPTIYSSLEECWKASEEASESLVLFYACLIVCEILKHTGTIMNVDECNVCGGTSKIAGISQRQGGFVCLDHINLEQGDALFSKVQLRQLRWLIKVPYSKLDTLKQVPWDWSLLIFLLDWYVYTNDAPIKSLPFLKSLLNM